MNRPIFIQSLVAGILAAVAANIYNQIYFFATQIDYSVMVNVWSITGVNILVSLFAGLLYAMLVRFFKSKGHIIFYFLYSIGSFACIVIPLAITLPLSTPFPELFPGLTIPMVFFPCIAWMTIDPLFKKN
ncbi:MAG TPA: hypothetical protein PLR06_12085 [Cyclobacteriaceae bacterium]|nr:hypothetical protein [Cyclobacteriaceae bacterium]